MSARLLRIVWVAAVLPSPAVAQVDAPRVDQARESIAPSPPRAGSRFAAACAEALVDQAGGSCIPGSRTPTLGMVYPMSVNLNVDSGTGNVDFANNITKGGTLFINTNGSGSTAIGLEALASSTGSNNTAVGFAALMSNSDGSRNTATGREALYSNTIGNGNTANGHRALISNTTGSFNTATGDDAMLLNTTGWWNTAHGTEALHANSFGSGNTAVGSRALRENIAGQCNTAAGYQALRFNTLGEQNTATGAEALESNTLGSSNTASGYRALWANTTGIENTASGVLALQFNTTGSGNTAIGSGSMDLNETGACNTAVGRGSLNLNTTGSHNTAAGFQALAFNCTGARNAALGFEAGRNNEGDDNVFVGYRSGYDLTNGSDNILVGNRGVSTESRTIRIGDADQSRAFFAGIRGVTTSNADAIPVLIDSAGQLGTVSSSRRFKEDVRDMGEASDRLLALRPVLFRYKEEVQSGERAQEYGLIAEEVAEVFPDLVVYDDGGKPFTVKYHLLSSMLLNELQKVSAQLGAQAERLAALEQRVPPSVGEACSRTGCSIAEPGSARRMQDGLEHTR